MKNSIAKTLIYGSLISVALVSLNASAAKNYDTKKISSKPSSAISLVSGYTYDFGGREIDGSKIKDNGVFRCFNKKDITIKNVTVKNNPRYAFIARGCNNVTISNFTMKDMNDSKGGIRFDKGTANKSVKISNINADSIGGHAVELWDTNGFTIGNITANNTKGCGLLLNRSRNGTVGTVKGNKNNKGGGYATFRVANNNGPNVNVNKVVSRNSGRGFFSVSGSKGTTVNFVDIAGTTKEGIYIQDSSDTLVKNGKVRGNPNCRIRNGNGNAIKADCGGKIDK